jgi:wyosine [tRNA(Phe)-imidazoG37] synthetase (radical SAM superfamily)
VKKEKYIFGPVASRRLGLSLGVDIVPAKVCSLDCIYCQVGRTTKKTVKRREYVPIKAVLAELKARLKYMKHGQDAHATIKHGQDARATVDYITISGSGEPTLNSKIGVLIDRIKKRTDIPVAIMTNGTLLYMADVRRDCAKADVVLPSLDAADEETFEKINRPDRNISIKKVVEGMIEFRKEYKGQIWLEVFIVEKVNTGRRALAAIKKAIKKIKPDKVQLNTAVRPTAEPGVKKVRLEKLKKIARSIGSGCEVIADFSKDEVTGERIDAERGAEEKLLSILKRRPCSLREICIVLGISKKTALAYAMNLVKSGLVQRERKNGEVFFKIK